MRFSLLIVGVAMLLGACGRSTESTVDAPLREPPSAALLEFSGTADAFGHPILPAGTTATCEVHHVALAPDVVAVMRGLPYTDASGFADAEQRQFPNHATLFFGGCVGGGPAWVAVAYCARCRAAELAWEQAAAAAGHKYSYDAALRQQFRAELEADGPVPPLPAPAAR